MVVRRQIVADLDLALFAHSVLQLDGDGIMFSWNTSFLILKSVASMFNAAD